MNHGLFSTKRKLGRFLIPMYILLAVIFSLDPVSASGSFVASKNSDVYHVSSCYYVDRIKDSNKVWYDSPEAAEAAGKRGCSKCNPGQYKAASTQTGGGSSSAWEPQYIVEDSEEYWALWQRGYDAGWEDGFDEAGGHDDSIAKYEDGYNDGYDDGCDAGYLSGYSDGINSAGDGYDSGYEAGMADGRTIGLEEGQSTQNDKLQEEVSRVKEDGTFRTVIIGLVGLAAGGAGGYYVQKRKTE